MLITSRKNVVGVSSGNWIDQKRRHGRAPSLAPGPQSHLGVDRNPGRQNPKL
jgi:hypothetical protein